MWALARIADYGADTLVVRHIEELSPDRSSLTPLLAWFTDSRRDLVAIADVSQQHG